MTNERRKLLERLRGYQQDLRKAIFFDAEKEVKKYREFFENQRMPEHSERYLKKK